VNKLSISGFSQNWSITSQVSLPPWEWGDTKAENHSWDGSPKAGASLTIN
jgi:hypothetical protein